VRDILRRALIGWLRLMTESAERVSDTTESVLRRLGADPDAGPEHAVVAALTAQVREILDLPPPGPDGHGPLGEETGDAELLRRRFSELLDRSTAAAPEPGIHPAFRRIIDEISPDEARIIRLFHGDGPQPVVHVVASPRIGSGGSTVLENLSLIGDRAGCHHPDLAPSYLENLTRLGVVKIHEEELIDHDDYELIETRPEFHAAEERIEEELRQRPKAERRTAKLTALGERFCEVCLVER
jgi:hypothetical protein